MTRKYFGTDGVRGRVGEIPITPEFVMHLGYSAGKVLASSDWHLSKGERPAVLIGKDTRISGYMLESALQAGLSAAGVDVLLSGPTPTPAVAYLTRALRLQAGIVISASHNPFEDNGIKFFSAAGSKLPDATEHEIEAGLNAPIKSMPSARLGKARRVDDARGRYIEFCKSTFPNHLDLRGLRMRALKEVAQAGFLETQQHVRSFDLSAFAMRRFDLQRCVGFAQYRADFKVAVFFVQDVHRTRRTPVRRCGERRDYSAANPANCRMRGMCTGKLCTL